MLRKSRTERINAKTDFGAVEAWCTAVLVKAEKVAVKPRPRLNAEVAARQLAKVGAIQNGHLSSKKSWRDSVLP